MVCTYNADEVIVTYNAPVRGPVNVVLPVASDFAGKVVTIRDDIGYGSTPQFGFDVSSCDFEPAIASVMLTMNNFEPVFGNSDYTRSFSAGQTAIFYSSGNRWELIAVWNKN
jgi:hypothetical protein